MSKHLARQETAKIKPGPTAMRAATAVCRDRGISTITLWRMRRKGWIECANVCGKIYVIMASLAEFDRRAALGEFAKAPRGAARKSAEASAASR
jgi:hypothetical protein